MTEPLRWTLAVTAAAVTHLLLLAWALPGFSLWPAGAVPVNQSVSLVGDGVEIDKPFVPVTLPSGPLALEWSLGSMTPPPRTAPQFQRPEGVRAGQMALSGFGEAAIEGQQAALREALSDDLRRLDALAAAPAEFVAEISLAGAQLRLAPMVGSLPLKESDALAHQTTGQDAAVATAPRPAAQVQTAAPSPEPVAVAAAAPTAETKPSSSPANNLAAQPTQPFPSALRTTPTAPATQPPNPAPSPVVTPTTAPTDARRPDPTPQEAMATATPAPTRIVPDIYPPAPPATPLIIPVPPRLILELDPPAAPTNSPSPTLIPLPELSAPQPPQEMPQRRDLMLGERNAPDQGAGEFTPNSNVFFSALTSHLFAANQRALAEAIRAGPRLTLEVRFWIDRDGRVLDARVARTSGIPELDRRAEQVLLDASPVPRLARDMPQETLELSFPVDVYR